MASETTTETLRAAIETALRRRDPRATVRRSPTESDRSLWIARWPRLEMMTRGDDGYFGLDGLRALALACGLRPDGSDPAEEVERLRAVVAGDPTPRMIRTEDVARALWPFVYAGRRDACDDEGFGPRFGDLAQTTQDLFCALIDEAMQTMGAAIKRDPAEEDRRAVAAAWFFDAFAARGKRITELAAERDEARAEIERLRTDNARLDDATRGALDDLARVRGEFDAARAAAREYLAAIDEHDKARRAPAQKGSYMRLVEAQDRLDAAREALRKITEEDGR